MNKFIIFIFLLFLSKFCLSDSCKLKVYLNEKYKGFNVSLISYYPYKNYNTKISGDSLTYTFSGDLEKLYQSCVLIIRKGRTYYSLDIFLQKGNSEMYIRNLTNGGLNDDIRFIKFPLLAQQQHYWKLTRAFNFRIDSCSKVLDNYLNTDSAVFKQTNEFKNSLAKQLFKNQLAFIEKYPNSYFSLFFFDEYVLKNILLNPDTIANIFGAMGYDLKETLYGKQIRRKLEILQSLKIGSFFPDASFITSSGKKCRLSDFRNEKYILVCFWGSWCSPCVKGIPILKELFNRYSTKGLEMFSIAVDDKLDQWEMALQKYNMPWSQIFCDTNNMPSIETKNKYNLLVFPQYFLMDKQGRIIYHNVVLNDNEDYSILNDVLFKNLK